MQPARQFPHKERRRWCSRPPRAPTASDASELSVCVLHDVNGEVLLQTPPPAAPTNSVPPFRSESKSTDSSRPLSANAPLPMGAGPIGLHVPPTMADLLCTPLCALATSARCSLNAFCTRFCFGFPLAPSGIHPIRERSYKSFLRVDPVGPGMRDEMLLRFRRSGARQSRLSGGCHGRRNSETGKGDCNDRTDRGHGSDARAQVHSVIPLRMCFCAAYHEPRKIDDSTVAASPMTHHTAQNSTKHNRVKQIDIAPYATRHSTATTETPRLRIGVDRGQQP